MGDLVAAYLGYEAHRPEAGATNQEYGTLEDLVADFTALGGTVN